MLLGARREDPLPEPDWIAVDWGTSNVRAWGMAADGRPLFERSAPEGMSRLTQADYPAILSRLLEGELAGKRSAEVLVCGMAGAKTGWREAGYLDAPTALNALMPAAVRPDTGDLSFDVRILPGVCQRKPGAEDVMRGEETQLLGLTVLRRGYSGTVIMPGTHSKWVTLEDGRLTRFETAMTGELFEVLGAHSVLRLSLGGEQNGPATEDGIAAGMEAGITAPERLSSLLFRARSASLLAGKGADWCSGYLSGLLVGAEVAGHRDWIGPAAVPLIGSTRLCRIYAAALKRLGATSETIEATTATLAGLSAARRQGQA